MGEHGGVRPYTYLFIYGGRANAYSFDTRGGTIKKNIMCYFFVTCFRAVRAALVFGTNCFPWAVPLRFAALVAAYCEGDSFSIAFLGRYRSPVALGPCVDGLPDLVVHFSLVHVDNDFCLLLLAPV